MKRIIVFDNSNIRYKEELIPGVAHDEELGDTAILFYNPKFFARIYYDNVEAECFLKLIKKEELTKNDYNILIKNNSLTIEQLYDEAMKQLTTSTYIAKEDLEARNKMKLER